MPATDKQFSRNVLRWFDQHGRKDLPWQRSPNTYRVWVSEIMLQQTQVATVIPYYQRFLRRFPTLKKLAEADLDEVLSLWSGLGYYARARNLHRSAQIALREHKGKLPQDIDQLIEMPGIGRSTAGAILSATLNQRHPILDGNVKRVLARYFGIAGWPGTTHVLEQLWEKSDSLTPKQQVANYNQAMMDLGATLCTRAKPDCERCPIRTGCVAHAENRISEYPGKKPRKTLPVKSCFMLLLRRKNGAILLEKRAPTGLWGGLLSLPQVEKKQDIEPWLDKLGVKTRNDRTEFHPALRHSFSHFHLDITPVSMQIQGPVARVADANNLLWYQENHLEQGFPKPVKDLLASYYLK